MNDEFQTSYGTSSYSYNYSTSSPLPYDSDLHILLPQGILAGAGTLGNMFFCVVVFFDRKLLSQRSNILLVLMALGNITYLISQFTFVCKRHSETPTETLLQCKMQFAVPAFSGSLCIFSLTACSIERYLGVVKYPLSGGSRKPWIFTIIASIVNVILALAVGSNTYYWATLQDFYFLTMCFDHDIMDKNSLFKWTSLGNSFVIYLIPLFIVTFCYASIIARIMQSSALHRSQPGVSRSFARRKTGIVVLLVITISFAFLWLPFHVTKLLAAFDGTVPTALGQVALYSAIANCILDPGLIFMLSSDHRRAVVELFMCCFCSRNRRRRMRLSTIRSTIYTSGTSIKKNKDHYETTTAVWTIKQNDMFSFVSQRWCAFWQKIDMLLKWSIINNISSPNYKKSISSQGYSAIMWILDSLC